jgi:uncharacterized membrane protein YhaH (DUF805 family)
MSLTRSELVGMTAQRFAQILISYKPTIAGRATRFEMVATFVVCTLVFTIASTFFAAAKQVGVGGDGPDEFGLVMTAAFTLVAYLPLGAVIIRRLHDTGRSAWALLTVIFPYAGPFLLLGILFWDGDAYENGFGEPIP